MLKIKKKRIVIPYRPVIKWLVRLRRSPRAIAGGFALGTFVAFSPTMGVQFFIAISLATVLNLNRPAACVTIWITNVATMAPIYTFNYWVGSLICSGPSVGYVSKVFLELTAKLIKLNVWDIIDQFQIIMGLGKDIVVPLIIGSLIVSVIAAGLVYLASLSMLSYLVTRRNRKRVLH